MVGAGAIAGTLSGGYTNAARSPQAVPAEAAVYRGPAVPQAASEAPVEYTEANTTTVAMSSIGALRAKSVPILSGPPEPAPAAVIATRFPSQWLQQTPRVSNADNDPPPLTMAYATEPQRAEPPSVEPVRPAAASSSGFALASVDPNPATNPEPVPMPKRMARPEKPKAAVLFNDAQLASIKARLASHATRRPTGRRSSPRCARSRGRSQPSPRESCTASSSRHR